jgi:lipopolysaccharide/colanic/teichoic acid biosynthesis glycosyltransferase
MESMEALQWTESAGSRTYLAGKRVFDVVFSLLGMLFLLPLGVLIAIAIKVSDGGPVFYRQRRIGQFGRPFFIAKYRTMVINADRQGPCVTKGRDPRITSIGRVLRKVKLDELPQLWNVWRGEMSFVGPRPEVPRYVTRYSAQQRRVLSLKPGITDLATLRFRNEEALLAGADDVEAFYVEHCVPRKVGLNVEYARRATLWSDLAIILQTLCPSWLKVALGYSTGLGLSYWLAYQLRFDFAVPAEEAGHMGLGGIVIVGLQMLCLAWRREFLDLVSYFGLREAKELGIGLASAAALSGGAWWLTGGGLGPPRGVILIDAVLAFSALAMARGVLRTLREVRSGEQESNGKAQRDPIRVGIVGAGELGAWVTSALNLKTQSRRRVEVLFDDDPRKWHRRLHGILVAGMPECLLDGFWAERLDEVIVAMPEASPERLQQVKTVLSRARIPARTLPSLEEIFAR